MICKSNVGHAGAGQERKETPLCPEILLESGRREEGGESGRTRHSVDLAFHAPSHTGVEFLSQDDPRAPTTHTGPGRAGPGPLTVRSSSSVHSGHAREGICSCPLLPGRGYVLTRDPVEIFETLKSSCFFLKNNKHSFRACWLWGALWWRQSHSHRPAGSSGAARGQGASLPRGASCLSRRGPGSGVGGSPRNPSRRCGAALWRPVPPERPSRAAEWGR